MLQISKKTRNVRPSTCTRNIRQSTKKKLDTRRPSYKFNVLRLKEKVISSEFRAELNKFSVLIKNRITMTQYTRHLGNKFAMLGKKTKKHKEWLTAETLKRISNTKYLKDQSNEAQNGEKK
jgi:hypothetical protein